MFVGHYAAGLVLKKAHRNLNLGWIFLAVMLPDMLLGIFVLLGIERIEIPADYQNLHYLMFDFPYSHGLAATIGWTILVFFLAKTFCPKTEPVRNKVAVIIAASFFSHFILDIIVHIPEIPMVGSHSYKIGLGLWNSLPAALALEISLAMIGLVVYLRTARDKSFKTKAGIVFLIGLLSVFTSGQAFSPTPTPDILPVIAIQWIVTGVVVSLLAFWLDRKSTHIKTLDGKHNFSLKCWRYPEIK